MAPRSTDSGRVARRGGRPTRAEAAQLDEDVREAALTLFLERGYEGTSMDDIALAANTTKASLYKRFESKDEVFRSVLAWAMQRPDWPLAETDPPDLDDLEGSLRFIARASLRRALHPSMVQLGRVAVAQAGRLPDLGLQAYAASTIRRHRMLVDLLRRHAATGAIVADEPEMLAEHFMAMVSGMPARLAGFGIVRSEAANERALDAAVQLLLRSMRPDRAG